MSDDSTESAGTDTKLREFLETHRDAVFELAQTLIGIDTQNPPGATTDAADWVEQQLASWGLSIDRVTIDPRKPNLLTTIPGDADRTLCFNGHLDTVPFDRREWTRDPLGESVDDRLYGRGATDMKGAIAGMLFVARAYGETGVQPPVDLQFAFVSDEETGGDAGLAAVLDVSQFSPDGCIIGETTSRTGRCSVTVADRGSIWLTLEAEGTAAHGSRPMLGKNAIDRLYEAVESLRTRLANCPLSIDSEMQKIVEESVGYYAPEAGTEATETLFAYPSVNLGVLEGGDAVNTVPASARAEIDIRVTASVETRQVLEAIRECVDDCAGVEITDVSWSRGSYEPPDSPLASSVAAAAERVTADRVFRRSATGGGDAKKLRQAGIPTVEFGFGTQTAHGVDEYITHAALADTAEVYLSVPDEVATRW